MLPIIDHRMVNEFKLPESKQLIRLKPYKTSQEKIILQALLDQKDRRSWFINIREIIKENCSEEIEIDKLSSLDFLFLCLKLRSISKGQLFEYSFPCPGIIKTTNEDETEKLDECKHIFKESDSMDSLLIIKNSDKTRVIAEINKNLSMEVTNPRVDYLGYLSSLSENDFNEEMFNDDEENFVIQQNLELFTNQICFCISKVILNESGKPRIYNEFTPEELKEKVIMNLTLSELKILHDAKKELISMAIRIRKVCPKCNNVFEREETDFFEYVV
jgi:hypothetical protein